MRLAHAVKFELIPGKINKPTKFQRGVAMNRATLFLISAVAALGLAGFGASGGIIPAVSSKSEFDGEISPLLVIDT